MVADGLGAVVADGLGEGDGDGLGEGDGDGLGEGENDGAARDGTGGAVGVGVVATRAPTTIAIVARPAIAPATAASLPDIGAEGTSTKPLEAAGGGDW